MNRLLVVLLAALFSVATSFAQTFTFEMEETDQTYSDGNTTFTWHAVVTNLLDADRNLTLEITPVESPDSLRGYAICTYLTCLQPVKSNLQ